MKQKFRDYSIVDKVFRVVLFLVMLFLSLTYVFMFVWIFANSLRTSSEFLINTFDIFDFGKYTFENYKVLFNTQIAGSQRNPVYLMDTIWNTVVLVFGQVLLGITIPALSGYIVAKYQFKARKMLNGVALLQLIVPTIGTLATTYSLMTTFELTNTFLGIFLMNAGGFGFSFLLFKNFFSVIPWSYAESAFLDGASDFRVFVSIMYPQSVPILTAIAVTTFIAAWNDYFTAYIYLPARPTISLAVSQLYTKMSNRMQLPVAFAGMSLLALVSLGVFGIFNKFIMTNLSAGGLKG